MKQVLAVFGARQIEPLVISVHNIHDLVKKDRDWLKMAHAESKPLCNVRLG